MIEILLKHGASLDIKDKDGRDPIDYAWNHEKLVKYLKLKKLEQEDQKKFEKIKEAIINKNDQEAIELIQTIGNINVKDNTTILQYAAMFGTPEVVEATLNEGADINIKDESGKNAIHWAVLYGNYEAVKKLTENVNAYALDKMKDNNGHSPYYYASHICYNNKISDYLTMKKIEAAVEYGDEEEAKELVWNIDNINMKDENGINLIEFATAYDSYGLIEELLKRDDLDIDNGFNIDNSFNIPLQTTNLPENSEIDRMAEIHRQQYMEEIKQIEIAEEQQELDNLQEAS